MPELLTVKEVARVLRWSPDSIYVMRSRGTFPIPAVHLGTHRIRFRREDLDAYISHQAATTSR